ncbi:MAG: hypothetical protein ACM31E_07500, partial [Fibrobacterota bacterium]
FCVDINLDMTSAKIFNCTFYKNTLLDIPGGIPFFIKLIAGYKNVDFYNNIVWSNGGGDPGYRSAISLNGSGFNPDYNYFTLGIDDIEGLDQSKYGRHNLDQSHSTLPVFENPENGKLQLVTTSAFVDAGDPFSQSGDDNFDIDGKNRVFGACVDLGAYELHKKALPVKPKLIRIERTCEGQPYIAIFGYENPNAYTVTCQVGNNNYFNGIPNMGQSMVFTPGENLDAFRLTFNRLTDGQVIIWTLNGQCVIISESSLNNISVAKPMLLSTLGNMEIAAGSEITLDLDKKNSDGSGVYVKYNCTDITNLQWSAEPVGLMPNSPPIGIIYDPELNELTIAPSHLFVPGQSFQLKLKVIDPSYSTLADERIVTFTIVKSGFDLRNLTMIHENNGLLHGSLECARNTTPLNISQERFYIYEGTDLTNNDRTTMKFISGVKLTVVSLPKSLGGTDIYGKYEIVFNPAEKLVYNPDGSSSGIYLHEWARKNATISRTKKMTFLIPFKTVYDNVEYKQVTVSPVDFDGPYLSFLTITENTSSSQRLEWSKPDEELSSLELTITPLGDNPPSGWTVNLTASLPSITSYPVIFLQDSRLYRYSLVATDTKGNSRIVQAEKMTLSGKYSIAGQITGNFDPVTNPVTVQLYRQKENSQDYETVSSVQLTSANSYSFSDLDNGNYIVKPVLVNYYALPVEKKVTLLRANVTNLDFILNPAPVILPNGLQVRQLTGSGDLEIKAIVSGEFSDELPYQIRLKWINEYENESDEELFTVSNPLIVHNENGSTTWTCIIPRSSIANQILYRTRSFDEYIRYVDAELITRTALYAPFRVNTWSYPLQKGNHILFAPQWFKKPETPEILGLNTFQSSIEMTVKNNDRALGQYTQLRRVRTDNPSNPVVRNYDLGLARKDVTYKALDGSKNSWIFFLAEWKNAVTFPLQDGAQFLSGYIENEGKAVPCGRFYSNSNVPNNSSSISFRVFAPEAGNYAVWMHGFNTSTTKAEFNIGVNGTLVRNLNNDDHTGNFPARQPLCWRPAFDKTLFPQCDDHSITLNAGINTIELFNTSPELVIDAVALHRENSSWTWCKTAPTDDLIDSLGEASLYNGSVYVSETSLAPDTR